MTDELLTTAEVGKMLRVSQNTVSRRVRLGDLQAVRLPRGQLRIRRSEVERVLSAGVEAEEREPERPGRPRTQPAAAAAPAPVSAPLKKQDRKDRPPVAMAIVIQDGKALMTHRRYKEPAFQWNFVSGEVEPGETPEEAAIREVREEVGLDVAIEYRLGDPTGQQAPHALLHLQGGRWRRRPGRSRENTEVAWCTLDEVYQHFEELAQVPNGMYPLLFEYLDRVLSSTARAALPDQYRPMKPRDKAR